MSQQAYIAQIGGVPVLVLKEGTQRAFGKEALRINIMVAKAVSEVMRTTLGPKGMDKMLIDSLGDITITNDGATILNEMDVQHPIGKLLVEIAKTQDDEVGDGTTTAVVLAGALLDEAEKLIEKNIHPTVIISGFKKGLDAAIQYLTKIATPVDRDNIDVLKKVAATSMHGKISETVKDQFAELAARAVSMIKEQRGDKWIADLDNVQLVKKHGGSLLDTQLIQGVVVDKEVVHAAMPKKITNAKIALLDAPLEVEKPEIDAEIRIQDPTQIKAFLDEEENILRGYVDKLKSIGANVVFTTKGIDDIAQYYLAKAGIMAVRRVKRSDIEKLVRATGGRLVTNIDDLTENDLGFAGLVEERRVGDEKMVFVEQCRNPKAVSILIRGGFERLVDEAERNLTDALSVVSDVIENPFIVPGGGAPEIEAAKAVRQLAAKVSGREQYAIEAFANALEAVPKTLAENAGLDAVDILTELRHMHESREDGWKYGIDAFSGKVADMVAMNIIEPLVVKTQAYKAAVEATSMILRIDEIIAASKIESGGEKGKKEGEEGAGSSGSFE
ncbi:thermosome subunit beta [Caldivirga maquilingensis]|uniref:Thermosome subunit beta n=1 Tax=Caldivirga maquilingensis (strain ATCC 700844 / DSM 13496 / JCM 10307 / IC-167) TaxID=397948 RepID=A8M9K0_CALMQ|nr:thermosome subunit beta [Caldivirga maquilingensis]ABW00881.1 thermosome [Caldivirga maquilingensis IC-167]